MWGRTRRTRNLRNEPCGVPGAMPKRQSAARACSSDGNMPTLRLGMAPNQKVRVGGRSKAAAPVGAVFSVRFYGTDRCQSLRVG